MESQRVRIQLIKFYLSFCKYQYYLDFTICASIVLLKATYHSMFCVHTFSLIGFTPQIEHNIRQNKYIKNRTNTWRFIVLGLNRAILSIYFDIYKSNILENQPSIQIGLLVNLFIICNLILMELQGTLGAHFFIPRSLRRGFYTYVKTTAEMTSIRNDFPGMSCSICLCNFSESNHNNDGIELTERNQRSSDSIISHLNTGGVRDLPRKSKSCLKRKEASYINTPCNHVFHEQCYISWIEFKNECPICRTTLPACY